MFKGDITKFSGDSPPLILVLVKVTGLKAVLILIFEAAAIFYDFLMSLIVEFYL